MGGRRRRRGDPPSTRNCRRPCSTVSRSHRTTSPTPSSSGTSPVKDDGAAGLITQDYHEVGVGAKRDEKGEIRCAAMSQTGDDTLATVRRNVLATVAAVEAALRASVNGPRRSALRRGADRGNVPGANPWRVRRMPLHDRLHRTHLRRVMPKFRSLATDTLWVDVDGRLVKVEPGEVIDIPPPIPATCR